ncbi:MAG: hypothetical protein R2849_12805 [Thermomicrobiales bacterium]
MIALISDVFFGITVRNVGRKLDFEMILIRDRASSIRRWPSTSRTC